VAKDFVTGLFSGGNGQFLVLDALPALVLHASQAIFGTVWGTNADVLTRPWQLVAQMDGGGRRGCCSSRRQRGMAVLASHEPCVMEVQHHAAASADRIGQQLRRLVAPPCVL
jgi:hypothetical protein